MGNAYSAQAVSDDNCGAFLHQAAKRFLALSSDERAKLQLMRSITNSDNRIAENLRYSRALYSRFPDERIMKFWLASPLAQLGERGQAAQLMTYDPTTHAILTADWQGLAEECGRSGRDFWDRATLWNSARLLIQTGHSDVLVKLHDEVQPLVRSGRISIKNIAIPETAIALRQAGRMADAERILKIFNERSARYPPAGIGHVQRQMDLAFLAAFQGRKEAALKQIDDLSRRRPLALATVPLMSLVYLPEYQSLRNDPRLLASDERVRAAVNSERAKAGMPAIARSDWLSDPKTLLTKN